MADFDDGPKKPALTIEMRPEGGYELTGTCCGESVGFWPNEVLTPAHFGPEHCATFREAALEIFGPGGRRYLTRPREGFFPYGGLGKLPLSRVED